MTRQELEVLLDKLIDEAYDQQSAIEWGHWADAELCADEIAKIREQIIRAIEVPSRPG